MGDTTIRLSDETKTRLEHRKRGEESFEAVINRLIDDSTDRDLLAGFGAWKGTDKLAATREVYERSRRESKERIDRIAAQGGDRDEDEGSTSDRRSEDARAQRDDIETPR